MPLIDHHQSHEKKKTAPSKSLAKEATKQNPKLPSVDPKSSQQKTTQKTTPKTTDQAASQTPQRQGLTLLPHPTVPPPIISTKVPTNAALDANLYLTRKIILKDLLNQCHGSDRLGKEGYFLGPRSLTRKNRVPKGIMSADKFLLSPKIKFPATKRLAIVIDCEMVDVGGNNQEVVFLSAIDFFTGEVLINNPVKPAKQVKDWRTKVSGVSPALMKSACAAGEVLESWQAARQQLWELMDQQTVLIGHSLNHDLEVLGMLHHSIVDSNILVSEAVFPYSTPSGRPRNKWGLKTLAKEFLNREIQVGKSGHSALEDAFATRDVVFWCMCNAQLLLLWATQQRDQELARIQSSKKKTSQKQNIKGSSGQSSQFEGLDEEQDYQSSEMEQWSDIADDYGGPNLWGMPMT